MSSPRGIRNRNPGNIVVAGWTQRQPGYLGPEPEGRFARFDTMANGLAALFRLLQSYRSQHGLTTVRGIINRWAPPVENDTSSYVLAVAKALNVAPDQELPDEPWTYHSLARAITAHENGRQAAADGISDRDYAEAMAAVFGTETVVAAPAPDEAPAETKPTLKERVVALPAIAIAAAQALIPLIADLMRSRGTKTSERNAEVLENVAPVVLEVAKQVVPTAKNEQEVAESILANKALQDAFKGAMAVRWSDVRPFLEFEEESRKSAREFVTHLGSDGPEWRQIGTAVIVATLSLIIVGGGGVLFWTMMDSPMLDPGQKGLILGALIAAFGQAIGFWFGSSAQSRAKDATISEQAKR